MSEKVPSLNFVASSVSSASVNLELLTQPSAILRFAPASVVGDGSGPLLRPHTVIFLPSSETTGSAT